MGVTFTRANCAAPVCNPSRAALMSGLRPSTTGVYDNDQDWKPAIAKDRRSPRSSARPATTSVARARFTTAATTARANGRSIPRRGAASSSGTPRPRTTAWAASSSARSTAGTRTCPIISSVSYGIEKFKQKHDKPFFLAVGLHKPHMPFSVPKKYFDMFPLETIQLPPHRDDDLDDVPAAGVRWPGRRATTPTSSKSGRWKDAVQAYLATIAFCDAQVGRLLDALRQVGLPGQHDRLLLGRPRLAPGRETPLAEVRLVGGSDADRVHLGRPRV